MPHSSSADFPSPDAASHPVRRHSFLSPPYHPPPPWCTTTSASAAYPQKSSTSPTSAPASCRTVTSVHSASTCPPRCRQPRKPPQPGTAPSPSSSELLIVYALLSPYCFLVVKIFLRPTTS